MTAREWIEAYGAEKVARLARRRGGRGLRMPQNPGGAPQALREVLGEEAAETLRKKHAGSYVQVPRLVSINALAEQDIRHRVVRQLIREGYSDSVIARVLMIASDTVGKFRKRMPGVVGERRNDDGSKREIVDPLRGPRDGAGAALRSDGSARDATVGR